MKLYSVVIPVGATALFYVEAETKDEAIKAVLLNCTPPSVCCQCARDVEIGELYDDDKAEAYQQED